MNPINFYQSRQADNESEIKKLKSKIAVNSVLRLLFFASVFGFLFGFIRIIPLLSYAGSAISLVLFLLLVKKHIVLKKREKYETELKKILIAEINACNYDFRDFDSGEEYINHRHRFSYDLDMFGKGSVFSMINRTSTSFGCRLLADQISTEYVPKINIKNRQEAIQELSKEPDFMLHFRTTGNVSGIVDDDKLKIKNWIEHKSFLKESTVFKSALWILQIITLLLIFLGIIRTEYVPLLIFIFLTNLTFISFNFKKINVEHAKLSSILKLLEKYKELLHVVEDKAFKSTDLVEAADKLKHNGITAGKSLHELTKLVARFDNRLNFIAAIFLEGFLLWDYHCLIAINRWKREFGPQLQLWIKEVAHFDATISLAGFAFNNQSFVYPEFSNDVVLKSSELGHPSIPPSVRVCNDFSISKKGDFVLITGANMAGKSTFLRTVGVNLVLARLGVPVCANEFIFKPLRIYTSMRTSDSLAENESYFYAELRRLKEVLKELENNNNLLIILDEILKGTNSVDKQKGSYAAMEKILNIGGTGIIATHDLALTKIADEFPDRVKNKCFEIEIDNAKITFDYKLYNGVTQKMNAMLLMEQMGIV